MAIAIVSIIFCFLVYIIAVLNHRRGKPPGPFGLPIVGYLPFIHSRKPYETFTRLAERYGSVYGLWMGQVYTVVLTDHHLIRDILSKEESSGRAPLFLTHGIMGGYGIICAEGDLWRDQRRLSIEWLRSLGMSKYASARAGLERKIISGVNELLQDIHASAHPDHGYDPSATIHHVLGNLMNDLIFGKTYEKNDATWRYLQHLQKEGVKHIGVSMAVNFLPFLRNLPSTRRILNFIIKGKSKTHLVYDEIITEQRKKMVASNASSHENKKCILTYFLNEAAKRQEAERPDAVFCNDIQLRHLMADLFGAGVDTTFTTIRWALLYIALHPMVQRRLREELRQRLTSNKSPSLNDVEVLHYLRATIAEVQRIRSVVPIGIPHGTTKEMTIAGFRIPTNTMIIPLIWGVHMNPLLFDEPDTFKPDRFLDAEGRFTVPNQFLPFQAGKRMCLGDELARNILHIYVAHIVSHFEWLDLAPEDISLIDMAGNCGITLTPPSYRIIFSKNNKNN